MSIAAPHSGADDGSLLIDYTLKRWLGIIAPSGGAIIDPTNPKFGAKGDGTAEQDRINAAIKLANAQGGGIVICPPPPAGFYGLSGPIIPKAGVLLKAAPGTTFKWVGGDPGVQTYMVDTGDPGAGQNIQRADLASLVFDTANVNHVSGIRVVSLQKSVWMDIHVKNATWVGGEGLRLDVLSGNSFVNNTFNNRFFALNFDSIDQMLVLNGLSNAAATTDNDFFGIFAGDIRNIGIRFVQWCDSHRFYGIRIGASGVSGTLKWAILNDSATPNADVGVYNEKFFTLFADGAGGFGGAAQRVFRLNWSYATMAEVWTSVGSAGGSAGQLIEDNNSQSHFIQLDEGNPISGNAGAVQLYSKNWFMAGPTTDQGGGNAGGNFLKTQGAAPGGITTITALGSDANVGISLNPKSGGQVVLGQQQPDFIAEGGGADGVASSPFFSTGGSDANIDLRLLTAGSGRLVVKYKVMPGDEAVGTQLSGGILHSTGIPSNSNGANNDWAISDNGHFYFKSAGTWAQKI